MFRKSFIHYVIGFLTIILVAGMTVGIIVASTIAGSTKSDYLFEDNNEARYHLMFIIDETDQLYSDVFFDGVKKAEEAYHITAEVIRLGQNNYEQALSNAMDLARYAEVDGVFVHCVDSQILSSKIDELYDAAIPVFLLNNDLPYSKRISYIGVNRYNIGIAVAKALAESMGGEGKIAVIDQKQTNATENMSEDMLLLGMSDVFREHENMSIELVTYTEQGTLSAETAATQIFKSSPDINGIFCTNGQSTLGIVQAIIDNNKVNDITLYGYGDEEELLGYIEKGKIVTGTIVTDVYDMGSTAIGVFDEYMTKDHVSSYFMTGIQNIEGWNLKNYLATKEDRFD